MASTDAEIVGRGLSTDGFDERHVNRELSWLDFDERVLAASRRSDWPVLERVLLLSIFYSNLDEFFQVRVAGLLDQVAGGVTRVGVCRRSPSEQLSAIRDQVERSTARARTIFADEILPELAEAGIQLVSWTELDADELAYTAAQFDTRIFPVLTPLAVDPGHPFPYISDLSLNLAVSLHSPDTGERRFARVKVPSLLSRFVALPSGGRLVTLEDVIAAHVGQLFPGMVIDSCFPFRVTRNADFTVEEDEADDLLEAVEFEVRRRRFGRAVRLEVPCDISLEVRELLARELDLAEADVYEADGLVGSGGLGDLLQLDRPDLRHEPWLSVTPPAFDSDSKGDLFSRLRASDVLVHHPYDEFASTTEAFIRQAASDPDVQAIKVTIYRTSGDSAIIRALIRAAEAGKQVAVLVELKARFDEEANIEWAKALEKAGVHVAYGIAGLKIHTKITLVVRLEGSILRRYCHIGTGNYNARTARRYEDLGLFTTDDEIGADVGHLFNYLTGYGHEVPYSQLLVAPHWLRSELTDLVHREMEVGQEGRIRLKMNSLVDSSMVDLLYEASAAGVKIDLIVRGTCMVRAGVPGLSENISVRSIVGRYLEHSRIFEFANGGGIGQPVYLIGSADWMTRNLDRRVEALVLVTDPLLQARLCTVLDINLADETLAWELMPDNRWRRLNGDPGTDTHLRLRELVRPTVTPNEA